MTSLINLKKYSCKRKQNTLPGKPFCTVYKVVFPAFFWSTLVITVHFPVSTASSKIVTSKNQVCLLRESIGNTGVANLHCRLCGNNSRFLGRYVKIRGDNRKIHCWYHLYQGHMATSSIFGKNWAFEFSSSPSENPR